MYTEDEEMQLWHERFMHDAFFSKNKLVYQIKMPLNDDLAWCKITHHEFSFQWWKDFVGIVFLAKMVFHFKKGNEGNFTYLFEVFPIHIDNRGYAVHGKSISSDYILVLDIAEHVVIRG